MIGHSKPADRPDEQRSVFIISAAVLIALCFHTERKNLFNKRRIVSRRFKELQQLSKHIHQRNTDLQELTRLHYKQHKRDQRHYKHSRHSSRQPVQVSQLKANTRDTTTQIQQHIKIDSPIATDKGFMPLYFKPA